jgi:hypothetical protein
MMKVARENRQALGMMSHCLVAAYRQRRPHRELYEHMSSQWCRLPGHVPTMPDEKTFVRRIIFKRITQLQIQWFHRPEPDPVPLRFYRFTQVGPPFTFRCTSSNPFLGMRPLPFDLLLSVAQTIEAVNANTPRLKFGPET